MATKSEEKNRVSEHCPVMFALDVLSRKWIIPIVCELGRGETMRYSELAKNITGITGMMLAQTLKELCGLGLVNRVQYNEVPLRVEYSLTETGKSIIPSLSKLTGWSIEMMLDADVEAGCQDGECIARIEHEVALRQSDIQDYRQTWDEEYERILARLAAHGMDPIDKLELCMLHLLGSSTQYGEEMSRMATIYYIVGEDKSAELLCEERASIRIIKTLLEEARAAGLLRDGLDDEEIVDAYTAFAHGLNSYWELQRGRYNIVEKNRRTVHWFIDSLRKR